MPYRITIASLEKLQQELHHREQFVRKQIQKEFHTALELGDTPENAPYDLAVEKQRINELRIQELREIIRSAEVVETRSGGEVQIGNTLSLVGEQDTKKLTIVSATAGSADPLQGIITEKSALGKELLGKKVGDKLEIGGKEYQIETIE